MKPALKKMQNRRTLPLNPRIFLPRKNPLKKKKPEPGAADPAASIPARTPDPPGATNDAPHLDRFYFFC